MKVRVKDLEWFEKNCEKDKDGDFIPPDGTGYFIKEMIELCGKVFEIEDEESQVMGSNGVAYCLQPWKYDLIEDTKQSNSVDHPKYYGGEANPLEVIKIIDYYELDFYLGSVLKYVCRAGKKDKQKEIEDLEKAQWYITKKIEKLKDTK